MTKRKYDCVKAVISIEREVDPILPKGQDGQLVTDICKITTHNVDFIDTLLKATGCKQHTKAGDIVRIAIEIHETAKLGDEE